MATDDRSPAFGRLLREYRFAAGLTQEALAERAGLGVRSVQALESGARLPLHDSLASLVEALALDPEQRARLAAVAQPAPRRRAAGGPSLAPVSPRSPLPSWLTSFIGREREMERLSDLLLARRLVTLTGPPGVGKTRLAQEAAAGLARHFADGVFYVPLSPIRDPELVFPTIAEALNVVIPPGQATVDRLVAVLGGRRLLLVLDNLEQVVAMAPGIARFLANCPGPTILATSRVALQVRGEQVFPLPPLAAPDLLASTSGHAGIASRFGQFPALQLFVEREQAVRPEFVLTGDNAETVAEICRQVDGLPLAIELAAARTLVLSPEAIRVRLERRLPLLGGGARDLPARQQTLREAIAWSYDLLDDHERLRFRQLSVFAGGATLEAIESVGEEEDIRGGEHERQSPDRSSDEGLDLIASLVSKSLLRRDEPAGPGGPGEPRFSMLATIHEYASELLTEHGEVEESRRQHAAYYVALAERASAEWTGPRQGEWLDRLEPERANLRAALAWLRDSGDANAGLRLAAGLGMFWLTRGPLAEGREWLRELLSATKVPGTNATRANALNWLACLCRRQTDYAAASGHFDDALAIYRELGDRLGEAHMLQAIGNIEFLRGCYANAQPLLESALAIAREVGDRFMISYSLEVLGQVQLARGEHAAARANLGDALAVARARGDRMRVMYTKRTLGSVAIAEGNYGEARCVLRDVLAMARNDDRTLVGFTLLEFAGLAVVQGQPERALRLEASASAQREVFGAPLPPTWLAWARRWIEPAHMALGEEVAARASAEGRAMTLEQAIEYALRDEPVS